MVKYTKKIVMLEALKYSSRQAFKKDNRGAWAAAYRNKWLKQVCAHIPFKYTVWSLDLLQKVSRKYTKRGIFQKAAPNAYQAANRQNVLEIICSHMDRPITTLRSTEDFKLYVFKVEGIAYSVMSNYNGSNNFIQIKHQVCGNVYKVRPTKFIHSHHRCPVCCNTSDKNVIYIWQVPNTSIYKIGITSNRLKYKRIKEVANSLKVQYTLILYKRTKQASTLEQLIHTTYSLKPEKSFTNKIDGYTEFRILNNIELNEIKNIIKETI